MMSSLSVTFILIFGLALVVALGCSKEDKAGDTSGQTGATADSAAPMTRWDSLATIRYPVRDENNKFVTLVTDYGNMTLELYRDVAPVHADSFVARVQDGFYDNSTFFRVIDNFMIQGGDPTGTGRGGPGYQFADELDPKTASYQAGYVRGVVAMANSGPNTNGSQFFIMHQDYPLDHNYTIFGRVVTGLEVVDAIATSKTDATDRPLEEIKIKKAEVVE